VQTSAISLFKEQLEEAEIFVSSTRTADNFCLNNLDAQLVMPPAYPPERAPRAYSPIAFYHLLLHSDGILSAAADAAGAAFLSTGITAIGWVGNEVKGENFARLNLLVNDQFEALLGGFQFSPSFLLLGILSFAVDRWCNWLVNSHTIQARIHDIGTSIGAAVITSDAPETRLLLFKLYRYLNLIHALTYQSVHPNLPKTLDGFVPLGLVTPSEVAILLPMANKSRDTVIAWAGTTIEELIREGAVRELAVGNMMIPGLRGICARHHDIYVRNMPNLWVAVAKLIVDILVCVQLFTLGIVDWPAVTGTAGKLDAAELAFACCMTFCSCFLMAASYWTAWAISQILADPFKSGNDSFNSDSLLASTDRQLFATLRSTFDHKTSGPEAIKATGSI
jgi:hypothetical protein